MFLLTCVVIFSLSINFSASHTCQSLNNVNVSLLDKNGTKFEKVVNGCIQRIEFNDTKVVEAYIKEQKVKKIWRDTVKNMKYLRTVSFVKCESDAISPIAFRNVPNLLNIEISQCKLKEIGTEIFTFDLIPKLETLALDNNEISFIEDKSFLNLTRLKKIDFHNNQLESWRQEWFENATTLETMDFRHNKIRELPRKAFMELRTLQRICFDYNDIRKIQRDAFKNIRSLEYLGLSHNKLTALEPSSFPNTVRVETFTIQANYFNYLPYSVLKQLAAVKITMDYNPWNCDCLKRINYWLDIKNGKSVMADYCRRHDVPVCAFPQNSSQACSDSVDAELTERYIRLLRNLSRALDPRCARLE